jgi:hypothetical protein
MGTNTLLEAVVLLNETRRLAASILAASCSLFEPDPPRGQKAKGLPPLRLKCREQYPLLWDSFEQPSFEHSLRHCLPLNFFLIPFGVETTSPFLYL